MSGAIVANTSPRDRSPDSIRPSPSASATHIAWLRCVSRTSMLRDLSIRTTTAPCSSSASSRRATGRATDTASATSAAHRSPGSTTRHTPGSTRVCPG
jgi:hypothetical protein